MTYEVYLDDEILFYPGDEKYIISNAVLNQELNVVSTFEFDISSKNPRYNDLYIGETYVKIVKDGQFVFYGKVTEIETSLDFTKHIYVRGIEGELFGWIDRPGAGTGETEIANVLDGPISFQTYYNGSLGRKKNIKIKLEFTPLPGIYYLFVKYDYINGLWCPNKFRADSGWFVIDSSLALIQIVNTNVGQDYYLTENPYIKVVEWELTNEPTNIEWASWGREFPYSTLLQPLEPIKINSNFVPAYGNENYLFPLIANGKITVENLQPTGFITEYIYNGKDRYTLLREQYCIYKKYLKLEHTSYVSEDFNSYSIKGYDSDSIGKLSNQPVMAGLNLIDFKALESCENVYTGIYARGTNPNNPNEILNIEGTSIDRYHRRATDHFLIDPEGAVKFGTFFGYVEFDTVINKENLKEKAEEWLLDHSKPTIKIQAKALDLSAVNPDYEEFLVGDRAVIKAADFGFDDLTVMITSKKTYLNDMTKNTITLGTALTKPYTSQVANSFSVNNMLK